MIIQILNEARKKLDALPKAKKAPTRKRKPKVEAETPQQSKKLSNIPDKLSETFGAEITANIEKYITGRIEKGLYNDTIIGKIPDNAIFFVFDTETTGLNMTHDDVITEIACLAYDKEFKNIDEYHATVELPDEKNPQIFIDHTYNSLNKIGLKKEDFDRILSNVEQYLGKEKVKDFGENEMTHTLMMMVFNTIKGKRPKKVNFNQPDYDAEDKSLLNQIYRIIKPLVKGENLRNILKMTKYGEVKAGVHEPDETSMVHNFLNFIHKVIAVKNGVPILVAHNFPYDYKMVRQAFTRANKVYKDFKFIDTAQLTRYYAYRYSYLLYLYNKKKVIKSGEGEHLKELFKFHPVGNARMGTLAQHFQIPNLNWHTAKNDVEATAQILKYLFAMDVYYKDYLNKKMGTDEHFKEIKDELDAETNRLRYRTVETEDPETGEITTEQKEVDWFSPLNNKFMSAHQEDFANFAEVVRDTKIYLEHFRQVSNKYYQKLEDFINKNSQKYGATSDVRRNINLIQYELNTTFDKIFNDKSKKRKLEYIDNTASLIMRMLKQTGLGPKDYIYYGKEIGINYKKYILLNYINEFAGILTGDDQEEYLGHLQEIRKELIATNKESSINGIKRRIDNIFKDEPDLKKTKQYQDYVTDIGASEKYYEELISNLVSKPKEIHNEFSSIAERVVGIEEFTAFEQFIKNINKKTADDSTRFTGPLWDKYKNYNIDNDYIREILNN